MVTASYDTTARLRGISTLSRPEMHLLGYSAGTKPLDVCEGIPLDTHTPAWPPAARALGGVFAAGLRARPTRDTGAPPHHQRSCGEAKIPA